MQKKLLAQNTPIEVTIKKGTSHIFIIGQKYTITYSKPGEHRTKTGTIIGDRDGRLILQEDGRESHILIIPTQINTFSNTSKRVSRL